MVYPEFFENKCGFTKIREELSAACISDMGAAHVENMAFLTDYSTITRNLKQVNEFVQILASDDEFPVSFYFNMAPVFKNTRIEGTYIPLDELFNFKRSLESIKNVVQFFKKQEDAKYPELRLLAHEVLFFPALLSALTQILTTTGGIKDNASPELQQIRRDIQQKQSQVSKRLHAVLKSAQASGFVDSDATLSVRNGRLVIPVSASNKRQIKGFIHDESATGKTAYVEPAEVVELNNDIRELEHAEHREIVKILIRFTDIARPYYPDLLPGYEFLGVIDFIRVKALYAKKVNGILPRISNERLIQWSQAVHPLLYLSLKKENRKTIPLDVELNEQQRILLISGPNAGGKSVCLQTVGLLQYMLQCGLLVPMRENSVMGVFNDIFLDLGDDQSIENDLSTYSSHLTNMRFFVKNSGQNTLVLIDEFGAGTEPMIGGAIAESILDALNQKQVFGIITTHYTNLKLFAAQTQGIINGAMLYDHNRMEPLFILETGKPGSSFAFEIARKIGLPEEILQAASQKVGQDYMDFEKHLREVARDKRYWERKRQSIRQSEKKLEETVARHDQELEKLMKERKTILEKTRVEASEVVLGLNKKIESTIREIRESNADKERTKELRSELEKVKVDAHAKLSDGNNNDPLIRKKKRLGRKFPLKEETSDEIQDKKPLETGNKVKMQGQDIVGEIINIQNKNALVAFGHMMTNVATEKLERISDNEYRRVNRNANTSSPTPTYDIRDKRLNFIPRADVRGKRTEEALEIVTSLVDEALMLDIAEVRILHGKGNGILRTMIRNHLKNLGGIANFHDESLEAGGAGITVVEL